MALNHVNIAIKASEIRKPSQEMQVLTSRNHPDYYTPPKYANAVRVALGGIDLDPASCQEANQYVCANRIYTVADDGLSQPWQAKTVFLNPPYCDPRNQGTSRRLVTQLWINKLLHEIQLGNVSQAILLVSANWGYKWFYELFKTVPMACITHDLIKFIQPGQTPEQATPAKRATAFFGFGDIEDDRFYRAFLGLGILFFNDPHTWGTYYLPD